MNITVNGIVHLLAANCASLLETRVSLSRRQLPICAEFNVPVALLQTRHFPIPGHPDKARSMRSKNFVPWLVYVSSFPLLVAISCDREGTGKPTYHSWLKWNVPLVFAARLVRRESPTGGESSDRHLYNCGHILLRLVVLMVYDMHFLPVHRRYLVKVRKIRDVIWYTHGLIPCTTEHGSTGAEMMIHQASTSVAAVWIDYQGLEGYIIKYAERFSLQAVTHGTRYCSICCHLEMPCTHADFFHVR